MDRNTIYIIITLIKAIGIIVGFIFIWINFIPGIRGDKKKLKKAGLIFLSIFLFIAILTGVEFMIAFSSK